LAERLKTLVDRGAEAAIGDVSDVCFLTTAFTGASAVFALIQLDYTATDFRGYYNEIGTSIVKAIEESGVKHVLLIHCG